VRDVIPNENSTDAGRAEPILTRQGLVHVKRTDLVRRRCDQTLFARVLTPARLRRLQLHPGLVAVRELDASSTLARGAASAGGERVQSQKEQRVDRRLAAIFAADVAVSQLNTGCGFKLAIRGLLRQRDGVGFRPPALVPGRRSVGSGRRFGYIVNHGETQLRARRNYSAAPSYVHAETIAPVSLIVAPHA